MRWSALIPWVRREEQEQDPAPGANDRLDVLAALDTLSPRQRACVVLRFYEDLSVPEIADQLGCAEGTVKRYLSVANARLRGQLSFSQGDGGFPVAVVSRSRPSEPRPWAH